MKRDVAIKVGSMVYNALVILTGRGPMSADFRRGLVGRKEVAARWAQGEAMTKAHSELGDNGGLCEGCNDPATEYQTQQAHPVLLAAMGLGGGPGWGTMWLCGRCLGAKAMVKVTR